MGWWKETRTHGFSARTFIEVSWKASLLTPQMDESAVRRREKGRKTYNWNVWAPSRGRTDKREGRGGGGGRAGRVSHCSTWAQTLALRLTTTTTTTTPSKSKPHTWGVCRSRKQEAGRSQRVSGLVGSVCTGWDICETEGLGHWMNQQDGALLLWL